MAPVHLGIHWSKSHSFGRSTFAAPMEESVCALENVDQNIEKAIYEALDADIIGVDEVLDLNGHRRKEWTSQQSSPITHLTSSARLWSLRASPWRAVTVEKTLSIGSFWVFHSY